MLTIVSRFPPGGLSCIQFVGVGEAGNCERLPHKNPTRDAYTSFALLHLERHRLTIPPSARFAGRDSRQS